MRDLWPIENYIALSVNLDRCWLLDRSCHISESSQICFAESRTVTYHCSKFGYELSKLVDSISNRIVTACFEVIDCCDEILHEWIEFKCAGFQTSGLLSLERSQYHTVEKLNDIRLGIILAACKNIESRAFRAPIVAVWVFEAACWHWAAHTCYDSCPK